MATESFQRRLDQRTAMLCSLCTILENKHLTFLMPSEVVTWWAAHKEHDRKEGRRK